MFQRKHFLIWLNPRFSVLQRRFENRAIFVARPCFGAEWIELLCVVTPRTKDRSLSSLSTHVLQLHDLICLPDVLLEAVVTTKSRKGERSSFTTILWWRSSRCLEETERMGGFCKTQACEVGTDGIFSHLLRSFWEGLFHKTFPRFTWPSKTILATFNKRWDGIHCLANSSCRWSPSRCASVWPKQ